MLVAVGPVTKIFFVEGLMGRTLFLFLSSTTDFGGGAIGKLTMFIAGNHIGGDGCEWHFFIGVEHAKFETCAKRAFEGTVNVGFGDETALRWLQGFH
jgi:hypothetical protein